VPMRVIPGDPMPAIDARLVNGGQWALAEEKPDKLSLLAFYRGAFCPICRTWLNDLDRLAAKFEERGVSIIALSCDKQEAAEKSVADWGLKNIRVGYELEVEDARRAGLYISEGRGINAGSGLKETKLFAEPAVLLVRPDGELYTAWIQSVPYARVHIAEILTAVDNFLARDLPAPRGSA
jgi:peroxiredoxin